MGRKLVIPARWGFSKGVLTGLVIEVPAVAATIWVLSYLGIGDPTVPFMQIIRLTAVFVGVAAVLTAGGIGRLAAYAAAEGGRARAMLVAARAHAIASAGLVLIAIIPHGGLPSTPIGFVPIPLAGVLTGIVCGHWRRVWWCCTGWPCGCLVARAATEHGDQAAAQPRRYRPARLLVA
jgi:hypothetical protein